MIYIGNPDHISAIGYHDLLWAVTDRVKEEGVCQLDTDPDKRRRTENVKRHVFSE